MIDRWKAIIAVAVLSSSFLDTSASAREPIASTPATPWIERALEAELDRDPVWQRLLQIDPGILALRRSSSATSESFFLAGQKGWSARRELVATLDAFFDDAATLADGEHPQCAFVARRHWLKERLAIPDDTMEMRSCEHYDNWRRGLAATGLTLIYPEGFMNNPASMFGHTLLRLDIEAEARGDEILGYAVDFTGDHGGDSGLPFIAKGIVGVYPGRFGIHPYYEQLRRYAEWENRDIWEYPLVLSEAELDFMLMHLWELRGVVHPYYFFTENCSYHLYRLLELLKPELRDRDAMASLVVPIDTVRGAMEVEGFVGEPRYRASPAKRLGVRLASMSADERRLSAEVANGERAPADDAIAKLPAAQRARVLDVAYERLRYAFVTGTREQKESQRLSRQILIARSRMKDAPKAEHSEVEVPDIRPDEGHEAKSASLSGGYRDDRPYVDFQFRPAFHGLMDREGGYPRHMQIRFFDVNLRYFPEQEKVRLEEVTLIEALSLSPRGEVFRPVAWHFNAGLATRRVDDGGNLEDAPVARSDIGIGLAAEPFKGFHLYGLGTATVDAGPDLEHDVSFGPGARAGLYYTWPGDRVKSHLFGDYRPYLVGDVSHVVRAGTQQRLVLSRNTALIAEGSFHRNEGEDHLLGELSFQVHF